MFLLRVIAFKLHVGSLLSGAIEQDLLSDFNHMLLGFLL